MAAVVEDEVLELGLGHGVLPGGPRKRDGPDFSEL
jgi:hypothetical protein